MASRKKAKYRRKQPRVNRNSHHSFSGKKTGKIKTVFSFLGILSSLIAVVTFLIFLQPKFSLSVGPVLNPRNPSENPIIVRNDGFLPIDIKYSLESKGLIQQIDFKEGDKDMFAIVEFNMKHNKNNYLSIFDLKPNHSHPIDIKEIFLILDKAYFDKVKLYVSVSAKSKFIPLKKRDEFYFELKKRLDGTYLWYQFNNLN